MNFLDLKDLFDKCQMNNDLHLTIIMKAEEDPKPLLQKIKEAGYAVFLSQTYNGIEVVVTEKLDIKK